MGWGSVFLFGVILTLCEVDVAFYIYFITLACYALFDCMVYRFILLCCFLVGCFLIVFSCGISLLWLVFNCYLYVLLLWLFACECSVFPVDFLWVACCLVVAFLYLLVYLILGCSVGFAFGSYVWMGLVCSVFSIVFCCLIFGLIMLMNVLLGVFVVFGSVVFACVVF